LKTYELRSKSKSELQNHLDDLKQELLSLRVQKSSSGATNKISQIHIVRKAIARVNTILSQVERKDLKTSLGQKKLPLNMRPKLTRALRRQLSKDELNRKTLRQHKKSIHYSNLKYAVLL
jgi:large subunit ribosomal protein L35e